MQALQSLLRRPAALAALLFALTLALYWRTSTFEFVNYDDDTYVTDNEHVRAGLSAAGTRWAFTTGHAANWHPLTWLSHQLDAELFGLDAGAHHRTNALWHALNAALLFLALRALTGAPGRSALVAALFAWHPLRVESVAWVAERKDLLSAACSFAALWAYARYVRHGGAQRVGGAARYLLSLSFFALGLLAKPMGVTLPFVLLLLDAWPLARRAQPGAPSRTRLVLEKLPFLVLATSSAVVTVLVQHAGGAVNELAQLDLDARLANAFHAYGLYAWKSVWPSGLSAFHLHSAYAQPGRGPWDPGVILALLFVLVTSAVLVRTRRSAPYAWVGWSWFLGTLVPVLGLVQVGWQGWAERYSYVPSIGLALALVWASHTLLLRTPRARAAAGVLAGLALAGLAAASTVQLGAWQSSRTLFERALAVEEANFVAHNNLAEALEQAGDLPGARRHYARALALHPGMPPVRANLARVLRSQGEFAAARAELERALADDPDLAQAQAELGTLLAGLGEDEKALVHLRRARTLLPADTTVANVLAWLLATSATHAAAEEALALAELLCAAPAVLPGTLETRAAALARLGRFAEAVEWQTRALALAPPSARASERLELYRAGRPFTRSP
ncbi:MAG: tetratricopeptide repeat protein [Planctomycetes bacterium]|nr:tetratricopeptide repeat protein [Planctomycetota bacterium]